MSFDFTFLAYGTMALFVKHKRPSFITIICNILHSFYCQFNENTFYFTPTNTLKILVYSGSGQRRRYSYSLRPGQSGDQIAAGVIFPHPFRLALGPIHPPVRWVPGLFPGIKRPRRDVDHPPVLSPRLKIK